MKIALAQTKPIKGDVAANLEVHKYFVTGAVKLGASLIVFPELSLTGYEPSLAAELATSAKDHCFEGLQKLSDTHNITICAGMPTRAGNGINITMLIFQQGQPPKMYSKKYLHADEEPFFVCGENFPVLALDKKKFGLAICYEISVDQHASEAADHGATIYIASVAKTAAGVERAFETLADISRQYRMEVLFCNGVGPADDFVAAGQTAAWDNNGILLGKLDREKEGLLVFDSESKELFCIHEKLNSSQAAP